MEMNASTRSAECARPSGSRRVRGEVRIARSAREACRARRARLHFPAGQVPIGVYLPQTLTQSTYMDPVEGDQSISIMRCWSMMLKVQGVFPGVVTCPVSSDQFQLETLAPVCSCCPMRDGDATGRGAEAPHTAAPRPVA